MSKHHIPTLGAKRAIRKIGNDLRVARLRRRLPMEVVSERAFISRQTLGRVEAGDPGVSIGVFASVMQALGLIERLPDVAEDNRHGEMLAEEQLPKRIRVRARDV